MIHKRFIVEGYVFVCSFVSFESLREFERYTGLEGVRVG